ncbi:undecaprenyl-diphosphate phosphatase [Cellulomonas composti]|uniref:Undecaprenyl-diphosphatase n=1 Tax=Cellulomonas composti TaxID=266130 RepID=A0A511J608_9CELL|nr:undecaprenyl-diphosphate phosphatase [Cellulomonas composti]GEL93436.1 undecaprenyl-diphosphatase 2 [Cellulomonas composti]
MGAGAAIILGFVQGLTEFLPVSSSAHLRIVGELLGADPGAAFTAITQLGTETAVLLYFRRDIKRIVLAWWAALRGAYGTDLRARLGAPQDRPVDHDALMAWFITLGTVPIVVLGLAFQDSIEHTFRNLWLVAFTLAGFALVLGWADRVGTKVRPLDQLTPRHAVQFGFWQALALVPGVSRSGGTITGGLLMGYTREAAARYSFLLAIPAVFGSGLFQLVKSADDFGAAGTPGFGATLLATLVAFVVGYLVIIVFLKIISTFSYKPFVWYRLGVSAFVVVLLLTGAVEAVPA